MNIQVGDIIFFKNSSVVSRVIRLVTTGKFGQDVPSHVAIVYAVNNGHVTLLEANFRSVRAIPLLTYRKHKKWYARMRYIPNLEKGLDWAWWQVGTVKGYDYGAITSIFLRSFVRLLGPKVYNKVKGLKSFLNSKERFICSEFVSIYSEICGTKLWNESHETITPNDLFRSKELEFYVPLKL